VQNGCPYFTSTGLNGGWEWELDEDKAECTVEVTFVDVNDPFSSSLTNTCKCTSKC